MLVHDILIRIFRCSILSFKKMNLKCSASFQYFYFSISFYKSSWYQPGWNLRFLASISLKIACRQFFYKNADNKRRFEGLFLGNRRRLGFQSLYSTGKLITSRETYWPHNVSYSQFQIFPVPVWNFNLG